MLDQVISIASVSTGGILLALSFVGCVLPVLPGPVFAYAGLLALYFTSHRPSTPVVVMGAVAVAIALVLDYIVPSIGAKTFKCSRLGVIGCFFGSLWGLVVGTVLGFFFAFPAGPLIVFAGLLIGPFLGTLSGELLSNKEIWPAFRGALGSLLGFFASIVLKMMACLFIALLFAWTLVMN